MVSPTFGGCMPRGSLAWWCHSRAGWSLMGQAQTCLGNYFGKDGWQAMLSISERSSYHIQQQHYDPEGCHCALTWQESEELPIMPFRALTPGLFPEQAGSTNGTSLLCYEFLLGDKPKISASSHLPPLAACVCVPVYVFIYQESSAAV